MHELAPTSLPEPVVPTEGTPSAIVAAMHEREAAREPAIPTDSPAEHLKKGSLSVADLEPGQTTELYGRLASDYFAEPHTPESRLSWLKDLQGALHSEETDWRDLPEPRSTICMVTRVEDLDQAEETLNQYVAAQAGIEDDEVTLYVNYKTAGDPKRTAIADQVDELVGRIKQSHPHLQLRKLIVEYDEGPDINQVRRDLTDLTALDGMERGFAFEHPTFWLDSDIKGMSPDYTECMSALLRNPSDARVIFTAKADFAIDPPIDGGTPSDAKRLAAALEIMRRSERDTFFKQRGWTLSYPEEWASAFMLGGYVFAGGTSTKSVAGEKISVGEVYTLKRSLVAYAEAYKALAHIAKPHADIASIEKPTQLVTPRYEPSVRVVSSGRRFEQIMRYTLGLSNHEIGELMAMGRRGVVHAYTARGQDYYGLQGSLPVPGAAYADNFRDGDEEQRSLVSRYLFYSLEGLQRFARNDPHRHRLIQVLGRFGFLDSDNEDSK